jgi:hypothetical protein
LLYFFQTIDLVGAAAGSDVEDGGALRNTLDKLAELSEKADAYQNADVVARHVGGNEEGVRSPKELLFVTHALLTDLHISCHLAQEMVGAAAAPVVLEGVDAEVLADPVILESDAGYGSKRFGIPGALKKLSGLFKSDDNMAAADLTEITSEEEDSVNAALTATDTVIKSDALDDAGEDLNAQLVVKRVKLRGIEKDDGNSNGPKQLIFDEENDDGEVSSFLRHRPCLLVFYLSIIELKHPTTLLRMNLSLI